MGNGRPSAVVLPVMDTPARRRAKDDFFRRSHDSPLTAEQRRSFRGLLYFPPDPALRFVVPLDTKAAGPVEEIEMSNGSTSQMRRAGSLRFSVGGVEVALAAYEQDGGDLFVPFRDATSGTDTYGAGRYVEAGRLDDGNYELDLNSAYNPYCAYNENWRCPLPPRDNWLTVAIRAGEKTFPH